MRIMCAAIRAKVDGVKFAEIQAERHADCYEILNREHPDYDRDSVKEGFLTDTYRFVDRYKAKEIAVAAHQLIVPIEETCAELYSEDVW